MSATITPADIEAIEHDPGHDPESSEAAKPTGLGPVQPLSIGAMALAALVLAVIGLGAGLLFGVGNELLGKEATMVLAGVLGVAVAVTAATRFWAVVVGMFVVRASLDALKLGAYQKGSSALDPAVVVGLVFVAAGAAWLFAQWRAGDLHPMSGPTKWFIGLAAAGTFSGIGAGALSSLGVSLKIWAGALMLAVLEQAYRQKPERINVILGASAASLIIPAFVALQQLMQPRQNDAFLAVSRIRGTFVHPNPFATYLVITAVMALAVRPHLAGWKRVFANAVVVVAVMFTLFTYARGGWIALMLGICVVGICQDKRLIVAMIATALAALLFVPSVSARLADLNKTEMAGGGDANSLAWRIKYWERLIPLAAENPVSGIGLDQVVARTPEKLMPHNTFVQSAVETGVIGFTALFGLLISTAVALRDVIRRTPRGLHRGIAVGAAAAALGWLSQLASENLLTQAAIFWYLAGPIAFVLVLRARLPKLEEADATAVAEEDPARSVLA